MTVLKPRGPWKRWMLLVAITIALAVPMIWTELAEAGGAGPDVTVLYVRGVSNYGSTGSIQAYSIGTESCNVGTEPLWWCDNNTAFCNDDQHPVIAQNLYRLKDGRFEQLGMSWLKHGFLSLNSTDSNCGSCQTPPHGGDQLGVGCTDLYGSGLNGSRPLGQRSPVNATTGTYPYPITVVSSPQIIDQRLQVEQSDIDPTLNPGAKYWAEGHYVAADDAGSSNAFNNTSYREATFSMPGYVMSLVGADTGPSAATIRETPAIAAWQVEQPDVEILSVEPAAARGELFHAARRVTSGPNGIHYEYALHNLNSDTSGGLLRIEHPGATFTNVGFSGPVHHSGEPYDTSPWTIDTSVPGVITWSTAETFAQNPNANALRWSTMFTFWFDSDRVPDENMTHVLGLFKDPVEEPLRFTAIGLYNDGFESGDLSRWSTSVP